jgi:hypothetical protein
MRDLSAGKRGKKRISTMDTSPLKAIDKLAMLLALLLAVPTTVWAFYTLTMGLSGS